MVNRIALKRCALAFGSGLVLAGLSGCGSMFDGEEREPWRAEVEAACLASGEVRETAGVRLVGSVEGPGACGVDRPFRVSALDTTLAPSASLASIRSTTGLPPEALPFAPAAADAGNWLAPGEGGYTPIPTPQAQMPVRLSDGAPVRASAQDGLVLACTMVPGLTRWLNNEVQPAALAAFGSPVVEMITFGSYNCRRRNNARRGRLSEHAFANALDVRGFRLADGRETKVLTGWRGSAEEQTFWRDVAYGACTTFTTVLGPGSSDGRHENHLHLDLARHSSQRRVHVCRPRVPKNWVALARRNTGTQTAAFNGSIEDPLGNEIDE